MVLGTYCKPLFFFSYVKESHKIKLSDDPEHGGSWTPLFCEDLMSFLSLDSSTVYSKNASCLNLVKVVCLQSLLNLL